MAAAPLCFGWRVAPPALLGDRPSLELSGASQRGAGRLLRAADARLCGVELRPPPRRRPPGRRSADPPDAARRSRDGGADEPRATDGVGQRDHGPGPTARRRSVAIPGGAL